VEPFTIQCGTCQSRIRVRNPKLIGEIVSCPKCNGMIQVVDPQQQIRLEPLPGNLADSSTVTKVAMQPVSPSELPNFEEAQTFRDGRAAQDPTQDAASHAESSGDRTLLDDDYRLAPVSDTVAAPPIDPAWAPQDSPLLPSQQWTSSSTARSRQILLVASIAVASLAVAALGLFAFLRWADSRETRPPQAGRAEPVAPVAPVAGQLPPAASPDADILEANAAGTDVMGANAAGTDTQAAVSEDAAGPDSLLAANAPSRPGVGEDGSLEPLDTPLAAPGPAAPAPDSISAVPDSATAALPDSAAMDAENGPAATVQELPPALREFTQLFARSFEPILTDSSVPLSEAPISAEELNATDMTASSTPSLPEDVDVRLATTITGLSVQQRSLADTVAALSVTTGAPLTADLDSLRAAGVERFKLLRMAPLKDQTAEAVLTAIGSAANVQFSTYGNAVVVAEGLPEPLAERIPKAIPVGDLVKSAEEQAWLLATLQQILPELGGAVQVEGDQLTSPVAEQDRLLWFQVQRLMEAWRAQRAAQAGGEASASVPAAWETAYLDWPEDKVTATLQMLLTEPSTLERPTAINLARICRMAGLECWIDWPSVAAVGWSPGRADFTVTHNRTLDQVLRQYMRSLDVVFAIEDERTLWVTTAAAHRRQARVFVVPRGTLSLDQWQEELRLLAPLNESGASELQIIPTPDEQQLFLRACRPLALQ
jgi:hypothetical protein